MWEMSVLVRNTGGNLIHLSFSNVFKFQLILKPSLNANVYANSLTRAHTHKHTHYTNIQVIPLLSKLRDWNTACECGLCYFAWRCNGLNCSFPTHIHQSIYYKHLCLWILPNKRVKLAHKLYPSDPSIHHIRYKSWTDCLLVQSPVIFYSPY